MSIVPLQIDYSHIVLKRIEDQLMSLLLLLLTEKLLKLSE